MRELAPDRIDEAVDVLSDAFFDYPVMRYVIGAAGSAYAARLRTLLVFFTSARFVRNELVTGAVTTDDNVVGVANSMLPGTRPTPTVLGSQREAVWQELGADARLRYDTYGTATAAFAVDRPNYHLSMIGVRREWADRGVGRRLLEALHDTSCRDPKSAGVTLTTEDPRNVPLYRHFGYEVVGHARISDTLESWGFFRPDPE